ncbi:MAG: lipoprotein-releasing ABC transporter permease subunit [Halieaceae bacterium]
MSFAEVSRIALRYTFAFGRGYLSSFLSSLSMVGLILAITLLITVLSVMNGFDKEMRERILSLVPHVSIHSHTPIADWQQLATTVADHPDITSVAPFVQFDALFMRGADIETAQGVGLEFLPGGSESLLLAGLASSAQESFRNSDNGLMLGSGIAQRLDARPGDQLTLIVPARAGVGGARASRFETLTLSGLLETGTELDQSAALVHLEMASQLAGYEGAVTGLRLSSNSIFEVSRIGWELVARMPAGYYATNWQMTHGNLYSAIQLSRSLVTILLFSIIAVAAFNVVSSLVLVVFDKRGDIAILRTLGASPANIAAVFVLQGAMIGLVGVLLGSVLGIATSLAVPDVVAWLEGALSIQFLNTDVYPVSFLPVDLLLSDILLVGTVAFVMCVLAAIYPALRAARLAPASVLHEDG